MSGNVAIARQGGISALRIQTPEGVVFSLRLAGPVTRFLAWFVDICAVGASLMIIRQLLGLLVIISADMSGAMEGVLSFAVVMGYSISLEWFWRGQTLGKRLLRLRVVDQAGFRLHFSQVVIRNLLRVVDFMPAFYMLGGITALVNRHGQRLGDIAGSTVVVLTKSTRIPDLDQIKTEKYNSFRDYPHIEARLRQNTSPREAVLALQAVLRRNQLDPAARVELFHEIADALRAAATFPPEAVEGLSDEQYVRNAVEALFRTSNFDPAPASTEG